LEADGKHLMTDVYTSVGVFIGLCLVLITGWLWLDPAIAILVAANIVFEGGKLIKRSIDGLMDRALPAGEEQRIREIIDEILHTSNQNITYHGLRTRKSGHFRFADMHLLVPGNATLVEAHEWSEKLELALTKEYPNIRVLIHEEPVEDPRAYRDNWESTKKV
jgi:cation diffusion facilitator family transporter